MLFALVKDKQKYLDSLISRKLYLIAGFLVSTHNKEQARTLTYRHCGFITSRSDIREFSLRTIIRTENELIPATHLVKKEGIVGYRLPQKMAYKIFEKYMPS